MKAAIALLSLLAPVFALGQECQTTTEGMYSVEVCQTGPSDKPWPEFHDTSTRSAGYQLFLARGVGLTAYLGLTKDRPNLLQIALGYSGESTEKTFDVTVHNVQNFSEPEPLIWRMGEQTGEAVRTDKGIKALGVTMGKGTAGLTITGKPKPVSDWGLIYSRQPYYDKAHGDFGSAAPWNTRTNGGQRQKTSTEYDLVLDRRDGSEPVVIYNCTESEELCAAGEGRPDPGREKIIFMVARGIQSRPVRILNGPETDMREFHWHSCELREWQDGRSRVIHSKPGVCFRGPKYAGGNRIIYESDQDGFHPPLAYNGDRFQEDTAFHVYTARLVDGTLVDELNLSKHEWATRSPEVFSDGDVVYTSYHGTLPGKKPSPLNFWWLSSISGFDLLNAHGAAPFAAVSLLRGVVDPNRRGPGSAPILIPRPVSECQKGKLCFGSYYRDNHMDGGGDLYICDKLPPGVEGALRESDIEGSAGASTIPGSGRYIPSSCRLAVAYGMGQDISDPRFALDKGSKELFGQALGSAGQPFPLPGGWGYVHYTGHPYFVLTANRASREYMKTDVARAYPVRVKVDTVSNAYDRSQVEPLACTEGKYNCFDAYPWATYEALYGQSEPMPLKIDHGEGPARLIVVDGRKAELYPIPANIVAGMNMTTEQAKTVFQGDFDEGFPGALHALRITTFEQHTEVPTEPGPKNPTILKDCVFESDGSLDCQVPQETPFFMHGVDKTGTIIARDDRGHSLRAGEVRCCQGCHDGHSESRAAQLGNCHERFKDTIAGQAGM